MSDDPAVTGSDASLWDVVVVPYDPSWPRMFDQEASALRHVCGDTLLAIEHVGSTAVPRLNAKPVIDIELLTSSFEAGRALLPALESLDYQLDTRSPIPEYYTPWRPASPGRLQVNLALHAVDHSDGLKRIAFRDHLRAHPEAAAAYAALKIDLARRYAHDGSSYAGGKTGFIRRVHGEIAGLGPETISVVEYQPE